MPDSRIFHFYLSSQHYVWRKPGDAQVKPTTMGRLLVDLPKYSWIGSQHALDLNSLPQH